MNKADKYNAHARHCMDMAAQVRHAEDKRSWLMLAETWLKMIPEGLRTAADRSDIDPTRRNRGAGSKAANLRLVQ